MHWLNTRFSKSDFLLCFWTPFFSCSVAVIQTNFSREWIYSTCRNTTFDVVQYNKLIYATCMITKEIFFPRIWVPWYLWCHITSVQAALAYPEAKVDESAVMESIVPSGSTSVEELEWDSALEWVSGVNGMRSCKTPPTGYAHMLLCWSLAPVCWVNLKSWGKERPCLPSTIQLLTWREKITKINYSGECVLMGSMYIA